MNMFWFGVFVGMFYVHYVMPFLNILYELFGSKVGVKMSKDQVTINKCAIDIEIEKSKIETGGGVAMGFHHEPDEEYYYEEDEEFEE